MISRYGRGAASPAFTRGWESRPSSTVKLSRIPPTLPSPARFRLERFRENESHKQSLPDPIEADEGHSAVLALGLACLRQLTALGLSLQARAMEKGGG